MSIKSVEGQCATLLALTTMMLSVASGRANAQAAPGGRAAGMADAFVAVADDGSAVYWNPAGLVSGPLLNLQADFRRLERGDAGADAPDGAARGSATLFAVSVPPLGIGYYRLRSTEVGPPRTAEADQLGREKDWRTLHVLTTHHVGVTVLQSVGEWLTVGATAKVIVGVTGSAVTDARSGPLDAWFDEADALETDGDVRGDVDVGAMVDVRRVRLGFVARNLTEPRFGGETVGSRQTADGGPELVTATLHREARVGAAWGSGWPGQSRVIVAADADLTRRVEATAERRDLGAGVETWWRDAKLGVRSGLRASTVGAARPIVTGGLSVGVRRGIFVDGHAAWGRDEGRGWGLGARLVF